MAAQVDTSSNPMTSADTLASSNAQDAASQNNRQPIINPLYELSQRNNGPQYHVLRADNKVVIGEIPSTSYRFGAPWSQARLAMSRHFNSSASVNHTEDQLHTGGNIVYNKEPADNNIRRIASSSKLLDRISHPKRLHLVDRLEKVKTEPLCNLKGISDGSVGDSEAMQPVSLPPTPPASDHGYRTAEEDADDSSDDDNDDGAHDIVIPPLGHKVHNAPTEDAKPTFAFTQPTPEQSNLPTPVAGLDDHAPAYLLATYPASSSPSETIVNGAETDVSRHSQSANSLQSEDLPRRSSSLRQRPSSRGSSGTVGPGVEQGSKVASTSKPRSTSLAAPSKQMTNSTSYYDNLGSFSSEASSRRAISESLGQQLAMTSNLDANFEDSIAKEAEGIRRERQHKKLELEKKQILEKSKKRHSVSREGATSEDSQHGTQAQSRSHSPTVTSSAQQQLMSKQPDTRQRRMSDRLNPLEGNNPLVGNIIGEDHVNYVLMYNMLTGIRIGVSRCQAKLKRPLVDEDYVAQHKFSFDIVGNELTPSAKYDFKFKDYAPWVFRELREYFMLDPADYLLSLTAKYILSELGSPGKSGSFFYFSRDYRFIIKTIHHAEHKFLRRILKQYHDHVKANPHTLISRFYGLHRVKLPHGRKIHFVVMNNLMPPHRDIHETYDLKGSTVSREYPEDKAVHNPSATLKDLNWLHRHKRIELGPEKTSLFLAQLAEDTRLLQKLRIMDYSLLIGIHDMTRGNKDKLREGALQVFNPETGKLRRRNTQIKREREQDASELRKVVGMSDPKALDAQDRLPDRDRSERRNFMFYQDEGGLRATNEHNEPMETIYYLGVIDILTPYGLRKMLETFFKGFVYDKHAISPVPPGEYGNRFLNFVTSQMRGNKTSEPEPTPGEPTINEKASGEKAGGKEKRE